MISTGKVLASILLVAVTVTTNPNGLFHDREWLTQRESSRASHGFSSYFMKENPDNVPLISPNDGMIRDGGPLVNVGHQMDLSKSANSVYAGVLNREDEKSDHHDAYPDQLYDNNLMSPTLSRRLSASSALIGTFYPLTCNANLTLIDCSVNKTSTLSIPLSSAGDPLTIPCGTCYTYDLGSNVSLPTGLLVMGKLVFPANYQTSIYTSFVIVQGEMVVRSNATIISPDNLSVRFVLTGTNDTFLDTSKSDPNTLACNNSLCNLGKKPFLVAGGKDLCNDVVTTIYS